MLCFIGAVPGLITIKEWERLEQEKEIAEAVAAEKARIVAGVKGLRYEHPPTGETAEVDPHIIAAVLHIIEGERDTVPAPVEPLGHSERCQMARNALGRHYDCICQCHGYER
jgi:Mrp family chromosome partitioning ATPase